MVFFKIWNSINYYFMNLILILKYINVYLDINLWIFKIEKKGRYLYIDIWICMNF